MATQGAFTATVEIEGGKVDSLRNLLVGIGASIEEPGCPIAFGRLQTVHFMRWVILDASTDAAGKPLPASLVLSTNYDEPRRDHLRELVQVTSPQFDVIYRHCRGYRATTDDDRVRFLEQHSIPTAAFYVGTRNRGVGQIHREAKLREAIQTFLDETDVTGLPPEKIHDTIRAKFTSGDEYRWVSQPEGVQPRGIPLTKVVHWVIVLLILLGIFVVGPWLLSWLDVGLVWWIVLVGPIGLAAIASILLIAILVIRAHEKWEKVPNVPLTGAPIDQLTTREDQVVQNQLTNLVVIKPSLFRRVAVRLVLFAINLLGRLVYVRGALGGIPSIHFARWVVIDRGRRLLFFSNFDGSWENYLGDFIDKANFGLTGIWSNTIGCPPARFLVFEGASDERAFKDWVRANQLVTQVWYSAYRNLSVENINNNTRIRMGLANPLATAAAKDWLALL
jgi:hypothetical protein